MTHTPEVWDWVVHLSTGMIGRVESIGKSHTIYVSSWHWSASTPLEQVRPATPEEVEAHIAHISDRQTEAKQPFTMGDEVNTPNGIGHYWRSDADGRHRVWHGSECGVYEGHELTAIGTHGTTQ